MLMIRDRLRVGLLNPLMIDGLSHCDHLDKSTSIIRGIGSDLLHSLSKQNSPRWDVAFCGVASGTILFANVQQKGRQAYVR